MLRPDEDFDWEAFNNDINSPDLDHKIDAIEDAACESQACTQPVAHEVDGDQLCVQHYQEHWARK
jgi:hypothetical protein